MSETFKELYSLIIKHANQRYQFFSYQPNSLGEANPSKFIEVRPNANSKWSDPFILFHDQEPVNLNFYKHDWEKVFETQTSVRIPNILSNSEKNSLDKEYVLSRGYVDFYWFSNAFLALDWYKNYQYFPIKTTNLEFKFSCFNRLIDNRQHRLVIAAHLLKNYANDIILTLPIIDPHSKKHLQEIDKSWLSNNQKDLINFLNSDNDYIINSYRTEIQNLSYEIDEELLIKSFCHIVTETLFADNRLHLTEKIFRPIVAGSPFILAASPFSLKYLKDYGFKTFENYWDESYDTELNHSSRLDKICSIISYIGKKSLDDLTNMKKSMHDILEYNKKHFYNEFRQIISNELILNLETALKRVNVERKNSDVSQWIIDSFKNPILTKKAQMTNFTGAGLTSIQCQGIIFNLEGLNLLDLKKVDLLKDDQETLHFIKVLYEIQQYLQLHQLK